MKYLIIMVSFIICLLTNSANAHRVSTYSPGQDSVTRGAYTLVFINRDSTFAAKGAVVKQRMIDAFFKVYTKEAGVFNPKTARKVVFLIDPAYDGVAATWADTVHFNPAWMLRTPTDIDVVTHEVMHIVQQYGYSAGPVWLTEGIADYARYKFGVDNEGAGWRMPDYKPGQSYTNSYRITARFLVWIEENKIQGFVQKVDAALRAHTYNMDTWDKLAGESLDELWKNYAANPAI